MPGVETVLVFAAMTLVLVATPGAGVLYLVVQSFEGRRRGFCSLAGIESAELVYLIATAAGLSALLAASAAALDVLRYAGGAYLILMGIYELRGKGERSSGSPASGRRAFAQGFAVQILNPKVAIFFVAYFPQFVDSDTAMAPQIAVLGLIYLAIACASDSAYVLFSSFAARRLAPSVRTRLRLARLRAVSYIGLGLVAIFSGPRASATARP
jgi:threonine/homoserine/homoserine lactone efflux protein